MPDRSVTGRDKFRKLSSWDGERRCPVACRSADVLVVYVVAPDDEDVGFLDRRMGWCQRTEVRRTSRQQ